MTGTFTQGEAADQAGRGCGKRDKRREHNEGKDRTNKTVSFIDYERGNAHPVNINRGGYESMDYETETRSKSEACPHGCGYSSMDVDLVKAHLSSCRSKDQSGSSETVNSTGPSQNKYAKNLVQSFQRKVKAGLDDNLNLLSESRFWPLPSSSKAIYASMPSKAEPVRYNYNSNEWGLTINNHTAIIYLHDRTITAVTLNMFTDNALAKHEVNRSWKPGKDGIEMVTKDEFEEIKQGSVALNALNNFRCIYQKIWPLDTSVDALFNAVWRQLSNSAYPPTPADISELFAYWIQDRAQAAVEGRPPQTFVNLQSHLSTICQRRQPSRSENNFFSGKEKTLHDRNIYGFKNYRGRGGRSRRHNSDFGREPYPRQSSTEQEMCILFNSVGGCPMQVPAGGTCCDVMRRKKYLHVCNFYDSNSGAFCKMPHSVVNHR